MGAGACDAIASGGRLRWLLPCASSDDEPRRPFRVRSRRVLELAAAA